MTSAEVKKGIRQFLREQDDGTFTYQWLEQTGEQGRDVLLHLRGLPSASKRTRRIIKHLLIVFFLTPELEAGFLAEARSHPDVRVQRQDEQVLRGLIAGRHETRASLLSASAGRA